MNDHKGKQALDAILAGLDGVTPGEWDADWMESEDYQTFQLLTDKGSIADALNSDHADITEEGPDEHDEILAFDHIAKANFEHLARCFPENMRAIGEYVKEMERLVYVPGLWSCAKCDVQVVSGLMSAQTGAVVADTKPQSCPNECGPMWPVTERQAGNDAIDRCDKELAENERLREALRFYYNNWRIYGNSSGSSCGVEPTDRLLQDGGRTARAALNAGHTKAE